MPEEETKYSSIEEIFAAATAYIPDVLASNVDLRENESGAQPGASQPVPDQGISIQMMATIFGLPFDILATILGEGAEFWKLSEQEKNNLAAIWHELLNPIWIRWAGDKGGPWILASMLTMGTIGPRLLREKLRRESLTASTATENAGVSPLSPDLQAAENQRKPIDLSNMRVE